MIIEGIGDEVLLAFICLVVAQVYCTVIAWRYYNRPSSEEIDLDAAQSDQEPPPIHNPHTCPICWNQQSLALETNCGHLYCGQCLISLHERSFESIRHGIKCPMCRQQVNLFFVCFTTEERSPNLPIEMKRTRKDVLTFALTYNRTFSGGPRSIWDQIRDVPTLMRHLIRDFFTGEVNDDSYLHIRLVVMGIFALIYLFLPTDIFPEYAFGIVGLIDDIVITICIVLYATTSYRRYAANRIFARDDDL